MSIVCVDAGFLIGLYQHSDQYHHTAQEHFVRFFDQGINRLLIPWPTLYESVSTRMVRNRNWIIALDQDWRILRGRGQLDLIEDQPFRHNAIQDCLTEPARPGARYRTLSLTDRVIRYMLADVNLRIDALITYNPNDFRDVCTQYRKTLIASDA